MVATLVADIKSHPIHGCDDKVDDPHVPYKETMFFYKVLDGGLGVENLLVYGMMLGCLPLIIQKYFHRLY